MHPLLKHWSTWFVIIGLGIDLVDALTAKAGAQSGVFYGPNGPLAKLNQSPALHSVNVGEAIAMIGAAGLFFHKGV